MGHLNGDKAVDRVIRCAKTRRYLGADTWTKDPAQARLFANEFEAVRACIEGNLEEVELVLRDAATHAEILALPLR